MCTAIAFRTRDHYFGRTLDLDHSYGEMVTFTPRKFPLDFGNGELQDLHFALIGMAHVPDGHPLYFDAVNERGLAMAGLNFVGHAQYQSPEKGCYNIPHYDLIPWVLGQCTDVSQARDLLSKTRITGRDFSRELSAAQLHWLIADREETITLECTKEGLRIWENPVGVLTNNPPFDQQLFRLNDFMHLSPLPPRNRFSPELELVPYSHGMGALGLPGDLSSQSRFVRAAFTKLNSRCGDSEEESMGQFFHILDSVSQTRGCCQVGTERFEHTIYTCCCNMDKGIYYYTTYGNRQITALHMGREDPNGEQLIRWPLIREQKVLHEN